MKEVILPELGEGIDCATVACWHAAEGAQVTPEEDIVEIVTDKATFCIPAGWSGRIKTICVREGQVAKIGQTLALIEAAGGSDE